VRKLADFVTGIVSITYSKRNKKENLFAESIFKYISVTIRWDENGILKVTFVEMSSCQLIGYF
jgi:hypothetical protein